MAWRRTGDKPLYEPMMAYVADAYMRHSTSMIKPPLNLGHEQLLIHAFNLS